MISRNQRIISERYAEASINVGIAADEHKTTVLEPAIASSNSTDTDAEAAAVHAALVAEMAELQAEMEANKKRVEQLFGSTADPTPQNNGAAYAQPANPNPGNSTDPSGVLYEPQLTLASVTTQSAISPESNPSSGSRSGDTYNAGGGTLGIYVNGVADPPTVTPTEGYDDPADFTALPNTNAQVASGTTDGQNSTPRRTNGNSVNNPDVDWRLRISLASKSNYLYNADALTAGILLPLKETNGVLFPYTPKIDIVYTANYDPTELTHSNYKVHSYRGSSVDNITITGLFTAQNSVEASYLLAVIHFFRSVTKMFYGKDSNPRAGTPPPLVYLTGYGAYQFEHHPMAITTFTYSLPDDVDYITAGQSPSMASFTNYVKPTAGGGGRSRLAASNLQKGANPSPPNFSPSNNNVMLTRVPTKISITIGCLPIVTRYAVSNEFSLGAYGSGELLRNNQKTGGGMW